MQTRASRCDGGAAGGGTTRTGPKKKTNKQTKINSPKIKKQTNKQRGPLLWMIYFVFSPFFLLLFYFFLQSMRCSRTGSTALRHESLLFCFVFFCRFSRPYSINKQTNTERERDKKKRKKKSRLNLL